tara:strand:+ start:56 stop:1057 length:1002 start_codon:yes stop_codon:yes gene_type:complete
VAKPPVKRKLKDLFAPRDATETSRQGQGIGDIEAMRQMAGMVGKEVVSNLPFIEQGVAAKDFGEAAMGGNKFGMGLAALSALPMGKLVGKVAKNMVPTPRALAKQAAQEAERVANADKYFPIQDIFHSTQSPTGIKAFKAKIGSGTGWHDLPGPHVGTLDAATRRATDLAGPDFKPSIAYDRKTGVEFPDRVELASSIMPLRMRAEKPFLDPQGKPFGEREFGREVRNWAEENGYFTQGAGPRAATQKKAAKEAFAKKLLAEGYDVVPYINEVEDAGSLSYLVLNPNRLRSKFAKFDPKKLNSANLSAGLAGLFTGGAAAKAALTRQPPDERR